MKPFLIALRFLQSKAKMNTNSKPAHIANFYRAAQDGFASSAYSKIPSPLTNMALRIPSPSTASYTYRLCRETHIPISFTFNYSKQRKVRGICTRRHSNGIAYHEYAVNCIVWHMKIGINTKVVVQKDKYAPAANTIKPPEHMLPHFITQYWEHLNKQKRK